VGVPVGDVGYEDVKPQLRGIFVMIKLMRKAGITSPMLYTAGFASIGLSVASWVMSRNVESAGVARADRWGIFVGQWAPTFFALGVAMRLEEEWGDVQPHEKIEKMKHKVEEAMPVGHH
jgi:hypothetical protein